MSGFNAVQAAAYDAAARQRQRQQFMGMSAYDRHKKMVHDLATYYGRRFEPLRRRLGGQGEGEEAAAPMKTDYDVLREAYRFIRTEADDAEDSWEVRLARRYYTKLYREFCIADLSRHKEGRVGLRWRTQREVVAGKGQFACGAVGCEERRGLASFEVPFSYQEAGERKQALVKVRVCPTHAYQLNYRKHKEAEEAHKRRERKEAKRSKRRKRRHRSSSGGGSSSDSEGPSSGGEAEGSRRRREGGSKGSASKEPGAGADAGAGRRGGAAGDGTTERDPAGERPKAAARPGGQEAAGERGGTGQAREQRPQQEVKRGAQGGDAFEEFFQGLFE